MAKATQPGDILLATPGEDKVRSPISPQGFIEEIQYNEINFLEVVGSGAFGVVKRAKWRNRVVAVKTIGDQAETFKAEVQQLSSVEHSNIIKLYGICNQKPKVCLVMEYAEGGSLYTVIHPGDQSPPVEYRFSHVIHWALQCAHAVKYLHGMKPKAIIHRDLKPPNDSSEPFLIPKICDFGTACYIHSNMTSTQGSAAWMAPEVFEGSSYSEKCDVYSFGIVLWEMITRYKPYQELYHHPYRVMWAVHEGIRPPDVRNIPKSLQNLMKSCWNHDMNQRPPFVEIVEYFERANKYIPEDDYFLDTQASSADSDSQSSYYTDESSHHFTSSAVRTSIPLEERSGGKSSNSSNDINIPPAEPIITPDQKPELQMSSGRPEIGRASSCGYAIPDSSLSNLQTPPIELGHRRSRSWCDTPQNAIKYGDNQLSSSPYDPSNLSKSPSMSQFGPVSFPPNTTSIDSGAVRKQSYTSQAQTVTDSYPPTSYTPTGYPGMIDSVHLIGNNQMQQGGPFPHQHWPGLSQRFPLLGTSADNNLTHHQMETGNHFASHPHGGPTPKLDIPPPNPNPPPYVSPVTYQQQQQFLTQQQHLAEQFYQAHAGSQHGHQTPPSHLSQEFNTQLDMRTPTVDIETMQNDLANRYQSAPPIPTKSYTLPSSFRNTGHTSNSSSGRSTPISVSPPRDPSIKIDRSKSHSPKVHFSRAESQPSIPMQREGAIKRYQSDMDRTDFWKLLPNELMPATPIADNPESMIIYRQHLEMVDQFFKLQSEMDYLIQRKADVEKQLQEEEREQRRSSQYLENYLKAEEEHEEVLVLHASVKAQLEKVKQKRNLQRF